MNWKDRCFLYLNEEKLFEDSEHRTRFWELLDCYGEQPFFTKGLCKCMYLSAWDLRILPLSPIMSPKSQYPFLKMQPTLDSSVAPS